MARGNLCELRRRADELIERVAVLRHQSEQLHTENDRLRERSSQARERWREMLNTLAELIAARGDKVSDEARGKAAPKKRAQPTKSKKQQVTHQSDAEAALTRIMNQLQSTNEELETTNEELQSSNEELETTNEELQATNDELHTVNEELSSSTDDPAGQMREELHSNRILIEKLRGTLRWIADHSSDPHAVEVARRLLRDAGEPSS